MAGELQGFTTSGWNVYAVLLDENGQAWNGTTFETISAGNWTDYDISMTEKTAGIYLADMPVSIAGAYTYAVYHRIGGTPAITDTLIASRDLDWSGGLYSPSAGENILSPTEAATVLRCDATDQNMLDLLPIIDKYIEHATGRDWTADTTIYSEAKAAARMLLVRWHEDPGGMAAGDTLGPGIRAALTQLEYLALDLERSGVPDEALEITATNLGAYMDVTASIVLIFNHAMAAGSTSAVTLEDSSGASVAVTNSLEATGKIMTINPNASLSAASAYTVVIADAADIYGQTIETTITFMTA